MDLENHYWIWEICKLYLKIKGQVRYKLIYPIMLQKTKGKDIDVHGIKLHLDGMSMHDIAFLYENYEPKTYDALLRYSNPKSILIDIGANNGYFSLTMAKHYKKIFAIEPSPRNLIRLKTNIKLNRIKNITVLPFAIGDRKKIANFYCSNTTDGDDSLKTNKLYSKKIKVQQEKLDNLIKCKVDVIKIDAEGNENEILYGAMKTIKKYKPIIIFEWGHCQKEIINTLEKLNYGLYDLNEQPINDKIATNTNIINILAKPR